MSRELNKIFDVQSRQARRDILDKFDLTADDKNKVLNKIGNGSSGGDNFIMSAYYISLFIKSPVKSLICDIVNDVVIFNGGTGFASNNIIILKNDGDEYTLQESLSPYANLLTFTKIKNGLIIKRHTSIGLCPNIGDKQLTICGDDSIPEITGQWTQYTNANNGWISNNFVGCRRTYIDVFNSSKTLLPGKVVCNSPHNTKFTLEII